jgi:hypothetical protein
MGLGFLLLVLGCLGEMLGFLCVGSHISALVLCFFFHLLSLSHYLLFYL